jgi:hypothetical protein
MQTDKTHGSKNVREIGSEEVNWIHLVQDRDQWKAITFRFHKKWDFLIS